MSKAKFFIHESAYVEKNVKIGDNSKVWHFCHLRESCEIGNDVSLGKGVFIDQNVKIGDGCRIQNSVSVYDGVHIKKWVFVGPNVGFTNDKNPRAGSKSWKKSDTLLDNGCSIGAGSIVLSEVSVGSFALVGAASIVTTDVKPFHLVYGVPAVPIAKVCACGVTRLDLNATPDQYIMICCEENLREEVFELAQKEVQKLLNEKN